jgi:hypothetical protein
MNVLVGNRKAVDAIGHLGRSKLCSFDEILQKRFLGVCTIGGGVVVGSVSVEGAVAVELLVHVGYLQAVKEREYSVLLVEVVVNCLIALAFQVGNGCLMVDVPILTRYHVSITSSIT